VAGIKLRPYQENMVSVTMGAFPTDQFILMQAATGAGKTIYFCELIKRLLNRWPRLRIGVVVHRGILVTQTKDKMLKVYPDCPVGIASAGVDKAVRTDKSVTIGTIQTLARREVEAFDILFIDEVHRLPAANVKSQYRGFLKAMYKKNNAIRVVGLTATPFRLDNGYIYGDACKPGNKNWFNKLHYQISIKDLQDQKYLCNFRAKSTHVPDLTEVKVSGDFNIKDLSDTMSQDRHVGSIAHAINDYAADRRRIVVFCVTIEHAELVKASLKSATIIHSKMNDYLRDTALEMFENGTVRIICNVGVLTEGWDSPAVDCIVMARPTMSSTLYVQMTGRGLRPHQGKVDVLLLDLAGNCQRHGDPNHPRVGIPGRPKNTEAPYKMCPKCFELMHLAKKECANCGYVFTEAENNPVNEKQKLKDVAFDKTPWEMQVSSIEFMKYEARSGNIMARLSLSSDSYTSSVTVHEYLLFDEDAHPYARKKAQTLWWDLVKSRPPQSTDEAIERGGELEMSIPETVMVFEDDKGYLKVKSYA